MQEALKRSPYEKSHPQRSRPSKNESAEKLATGVRGSIRKSGDQRQKASLATPGRRCAAGIARIGVRIHSKGTVGEQQIPATPSTIPLATRRLERH